LILAEAANASRKRANANAIVAAPAVKKKILFSGAISTSLGVWLGGGWPHSRINYSLCPQRRIPVCHARGRPRGGEGRGEKEWRDEKGNEFTALRPGRKGDSGLGSARLGSAGRAPLAKANEK